MITIKVENMNCGHCVKRIDEALKELKLEHEVNLEEKTVKVTADKMQMLDVIAALDEMGFDAEIKK